MHGFYSRKNECSCVKRLKSQHRTHTFLNKPMILFDNVIEIFNLSYLDTFRNFLLLFQLLNGDWIGWVLINCYDTRLRNMKRPQSFLEKALCSLLISCFVWVKIDCVSFGIHCTIQVHLLTFYFYVRFIHSPRVIGLFEMTTDSFVQFRTILMNPTHDRCMSNE